MKQIGYSYETATKKSGKRFCAFILIAVAIVLAVISCLYGLDHSVVAAAYLKSIIEVFTWAAVVILVGGKAAEKLKILREK